MQGSGIKKLVVNGVFFITAELLKQFVDFFFQCDHFQFPAYKELVQCFQFIRLFFRVIQAIACDYAYRSHVRHSH